MLQYLREMDIHVNEMKLLTKLQWKKRVREAILNRNRKILLGQIEQYKKLDVIELSSENFETKSYFKELTLEQARTKFAIDSKMLMTVKSHFPSDKGNMEELWKCNQCTRVDSIRHLKICPFFADLREDKDLNKDEDLIKYFEEIIQIRINDEQSQLG